MKKKILILALAIMLPLAGVAAQEDAFTFLSFDIGLGPYVSGLLDDTTTTVEQFTSFGINLRVAGPLILSAVTQTDQSGNSLIGDAFLKVKYDIVPLVRAVIGYGTNNNIGLGFEIVPFKRQISGLFTEFKLAAEYQAEVDAMGEGNLLFGLLLGVGF